MPLDDLASARAAGAKPGSETNPEQVIEIDFVSLFGVSPEEADRLIKSLNRVQALGLELTVSGFNREEISRAREHHPIRVVGPAPDDPISPEHYGGEIECIDAIFAAGHGESFCLGNAIKYLWRAGKKPGADALTDLRKARKYLDFAIERRAKAQEPGA